MVELIMGTLGLLNAQRGKIKYTFLYVMTYAIILQFEKNRSVGNFWNPTFILAPNCPLFTGMSFILPIPLFIYGENMPNFAIKTNLVIQAEIIINFFLIFIVN